MTPSPPSGAAPGGTGAADPPIRVAVVGAGSPPVEDREAAEALGRWLARLGAVVVCGGLGGVMEAAARGAAEEGGLTLGLLPGGDPRSANRWIGLPLATGMGEARNVLVVRFAESVVAVGGAWGTLAEIALARKLGRSVATLGTPPAGSLGLPAMEGPEAAARWALDRAREARSPTG